MKIYFRPLPLLTSLDYNYWILDVCLHFPFPYFEYTLIWTNIIIHVYLKLSYCCTLYEVTLSVIKVPFSTEMGLLLFLAEKQNRDLHLQSDWLILGCYRLRDLQSITFGCRDLIKLYWLYHQNMCLLLHLKLLVKWKKMSTIALKKMF